MGTLDRYRKIRTLGAGGMATVVLAEDTVLGRQVALKRLTAATDVRSISRLRREALLGASISHPNVVSIYDVLTPENGDGDVVIVMEYVDGETLRDRIEREGPLPLDEALRVLADAAAGLDAVHARGIVHRDVKPANILLSRDGDVKVADLGIASAVDRTRITTAGQVLGSFSYMAPEQLEDAPVTPAIDVYALAVVAFEALTGTRARPESTPIAVAHAIATQDPPDLLDTWPDAPKAAADVLRAAMSRDPGARPASPSLFVAELRTALGQSDATARTAVAPRRRGRGAAAAAAAAAADTAAGATAVPGAAAGAGAAEAAARPARAARRIPPASASDPARRRPAPAPSAAPDASRRSRSGLLAPLLILAVLAIAGVALALANSGSNSSTSHTTTNAAAPPHSSSHTATTPHSSSRSSTSTTAPASTQSTSNSQTTSGSASSTAPSTTPSTAAAGSGTTAAAGAGSPAGAVQSFYELAASHQYGAAWKLADPSFQSQLGGYSAFQAQQSGDKQIIFHQADVTNRSGNAATVAVRTTSIRTDGTQQCAGTVQVVRSGAAWLLHQIAINCT